MRRWMWIVVIVAAAAACLWGLPRVRAAQARSAARAIESIEDDARRAERALALLADHPDLPDELRTNVLSVGLRAARAQGGAAAVAFCDRALELPLSKVERAMALAALDGALLETGDPDDAARADDLARGVAKDGKYPAGTYLRMVRQRLGSENQMADPWVAVELALAGAAAGDEVPRDAWASAFDGAYGAVINAAAMERGMDGVHAVAESVIVRAKDPRVPGAIYANVYRLVVEDDPDAAVDYAQSLAMLPGYTGSTVMNEIAYDMALRGLEPNLAVKLAETALGLAASRYDSLSILDTAGWAHHRAGNHAVAVERLVKAFSMLDETPSWGNEIVQHLAAAYEAAGKLDAAVDLLALVVSRSVDAGDPARAELSRLLRRRDGSDRALDELVRESLAAGREEAPAFALKGRDGKTVELAALRGNVVLICFWSYG